LKKQRSLGLACFPYEVKGERGVFENKKAIFYAALYCMTKVIVIYMKNFKTTGDKIDLYNGMAEAPILD